MKHGYRYLLPAGIALLALIIYFGYTNYSKRKQLKTFYTMADSCFRQLSGLRIVYLNELGVLRQPDIHDNNDLKDTALLLGIKKNLAMVNRVENFHDSAGVQLIRNWQDSLSIYKQRHAYEYPDSLMVSLSEALQANLDFFDSIRPDYKSYYKKYINLIDLLVINNEKVSIQDDRVIIMDKTLGLKFNELQVQFSEAVNNYNMCVERSKLKFIGRLRQIRALIPSKEIDVYLALFEK
jgi:hypothetical protein